ncbi:phosphotransferase [Flavobacteriaceae bacterium TP-CH-4]|uniref:Phosphotransferase n=2 Tax=Pelagihabitans pacificus TaxID=2696054 RepID=A0A967EBY0_9FLAO|nr:phosphotransferase [Pelagihabitans pacificus]
MNVVLRVRTNQRSFILKQSRPYVQKYRQVEAPLARIAVEHRFYQLVQDPSIAEHLPEIYAYDPSDHLMMMEDLGQCEDMTYLYQDREIDASQLGKLVSILEKIHQTSIPEDFPENLEMRHLNHQHIFVLPFLEDNGFELDAVQEGLQKLSLPYKKDWALAQKISEIGKKYLAKGTVLLHGDYYPGSWMVKGKNLYVIDPEFGFAGFPEFDLGVMAAHLVMATMDGEYLKTIRRHYQGNFDPHLMKQVAGIEIMRRLIGLAQLPLQRSIEEKDYLLQMAHKMILS